MLTGTLCDLVVRPGVEFTDDTLTSPSSLLEFSKLADLARLTRQGFDRGAPREL